MSEAACSACGLKTSVRSLFDLNGQTYCAQCVQTASENAKRSGQPSAYMPLVNRSICSRCNTFLGSDSTATQIGSLRFCAACAPLIKDWDYPAWLKVSLAFLVLLLGVALVHGRKYFHAGRSMYIGERLVAQGKYAEALPYLKETLRIAPNSDKAALLAAKAALLIGDIESADNALHGHNGGHFEDGKSVQFLEVNNLWNRANEAMQKAEQATQLEQQEGKAAAAAGLMHEAAAAYPELAQLAFLAETFDEGTAFERKDFDTYLAIAEKQWKERANANTAASLASSLACKYAVTGLVSFRQRAEEIMERSRQMAQGDPEVLKSLEEYFPRIKYRIETRQIISKQEYDRRFRSGKDSK